MNDEQFRNFHHKVTDLYIFGSSDLVDLIIIVAEPLPHNTQKSSKIHSVQKFPFKSLRAYGLWEVFLGDMLTL